MTILEVKNGKGSVGWLAGPMRPGQCPSERPTRGGAFRTGRHQQLGHDLVGAVL
jgi:hypothetical protein